MAETIEQIANKLFPNITPKITSANDFIETVFYYIERNKRKIGSIEYSLKNHKFGNFNGTLTAPRCFLEYTDPPKGMDLDSADIAKAVAIKLNTCLEDVFNEKIIELKKQNDQYFDYIKTVSIIDKKNGKKSKTTSGI